MTNTHTCINRYYICVLVCILSRSSHVQLFATLWTVARQAPLSMEFSRQEYWSGLPSPSSGDLPHPGIKPMSPASPALQANSLSAELPGKPQVLYVLFTSFLSLYNLLGDWG